MAWETIQPSVRASSGTISYYRWSQPHSAFSIDDYRMNSKQIDTCGSDSCKINSLKENNTQTSHYQSLDRRREALALVFGLHKNKADVEVCGPYVTLLSGSFRSVFLNCSDPEEFISSTFAVWVIATIECSVIILTRKAVAQAHPLELVLHLCSCWCV